MPKLRTRALPRLSPSAAAKRSRRRTDLVSTPTSVEQFVRRAAADALGAAANVLEVAMPAGDHRSRFQQGRYAIVVMPESRSAGRPSSHRPIDISRLPIESGRVDMALCTGVLDRVARPETMLGELNRTLGPRGRLYLTSPLVVRPGQDGPQGQVRLGMNYLLEATGFSLTDLQAVQDGTIYAIVADKARETTGIGIE